MLDTKEAEASEGEATRRSEARRSDPQKSMGELEEGLRRHGKEAVANEDSIEVSKTVRED